MKKETLQFAERQPEVTICNGGRKALVLINEREVTRPIAPLTPIGGEIGEEESASEEVTEYEYDGFWLNVNGTTEAAVLRAAKEAVCAAISDYDSSTAVNSFTFNGKQTWLDKNTRMSLGDRYTREAYLGKAMTVFAYGGIIASLMPKQGVAMLDKLKVYADECFDTTQRHLYEVQNLSSLADVLGYDFTQGYPERVVVNI